MNNEIKLYIFIIRKKILKLYIKMIFFNYKNIVSKDDANFFNIYDLSFIDDNYIYIINKLIDIIKLINDTKNNQLGGERKQKQKYSNKDNEEIRQLKQKINELTKRIEMMQQQQIYQNNNQISSYKTEMYQNALVQRQTDLTQCKTDNKITLYKLETQQNELNKCKADREILTNDNSNLKDKILFFDKSLEILSKEIDKNLNNGISYLKTFEEKIEIKPRENITTVNIELSDVISENYKIKTSGNVPINIQTNSIHKEYPNYNEDDSILDHQSGVNGQYIEYDGRKSHFNPNRRTGVNGQHIEYDGRKSHFNPNRRAGVNGQHIEYDGRKSHFNPNRRLGVNGQYIEYDGRSGVNGQQSEYDERYEVSPRSNDQFLRRIGSSPTGSLLTVSGSESITDLESISIDSDSNNSYLYRESGNIDQQSDVIKRY